MSSLGRRWTIGKSWRMRWNDVVGRFRFFVVHGVERSLKLVLRVFDMAENGRIEELIFVKDDVSRGDNAFVNRVP